MERKMWKNIPLTDEQYEFCAQISCNNVTKFLGIDNLNHPNIELYQLDNSYTIEQLSKAISIIKESK